MKMQSMNKKLIASLIAVVVLTVNPIKAETVSIEMQLPDIQTSKYQRPFVAVWIEQQGQRQAVKTVSVWFDDKKWLKDIRRWWRKAGRYDHAVDGITGATKPPGQYKLVWDGTDQQGNALPAGEYTLYLESVREHGNRTLLKQKVSLGAGKAQQFILQPGDELGPVKISIGE